MVRGCQYGPRRSIQPTSINTAHVDRQYYNKEYREGFPREFLHTAAVGMTRTRRVRGIPTAAVCKTSRGISRRYFFILSTDFNPLRCLNMSKTLKTNDLSSVWLPTHQNSPSAEVRFVFALLAHPLRSFYS